MRILVWNICCGGGRRVEAIAAAAARYAPDLAVLTEFRDGKTGSQLRAALAGQGLGHQLATNSPPRRNGILVAAGFPVEVESALQSPWDEAGRILPVRAGGLSIVACYFPQRHEKNAVYDYLESISASLLGQPCLLLGDFNTGLHRMDEDRATFIAEDRFRGLLDLGWTDAWRTLHPSAREYSWYSRAGRGFRIDHVLASPSAIAHGVVARYSHLEREQRVSDHSSLVIEYG
jgi:exodeoxyribonuclease-3